MMKKILEKLKTKKMITYLTIILIFIVGLVFVRNLDSWAIKPEDPSASAGSVTVEVRQAEKRFIQPVSAYDATLLAGEEGVVGADIPGKVIRILFAEGDTVKKGTPLIMLDSQDMNDQMKAAQGQLAAVKASLPKAQAGVEKAQRDYNNAKALFEAGALAANDLSNAETALKVAQADLAALQASITAAQSGVDRLMHSLDSMIIKAPVDGVVEEKNVAVGAYVGPGAPLAMVKDISTIQAVIKIAQEDAGRVRTGQKATVRISGDERIYEGTVSYVSTAASMASRTFQAKVEVPNPDNRLKSGSFASVEIASGSEEAVLIIPLKAVAGSAGDYYIFTDDNKVARRVNVELGAAHGDLIEIKSGLAEGTGVICSNINSLQDGDSITAAAGQEE